MSTQGSLPGIPPGPISDVVYTPRNIARSIVEHFRPSGRILEPCSGDGAFLDAMPGAEWCEITRGRDFFQWDKPVDWIVTNPPYGCFAAFLDHAMAVADNLVLLIPVNKLFNSDRTMRLVWGWGGCAEVLVVGGGASLGFPIGFCIGAAHLERGYRGGMSVSFLSDPLGNDTARRNGEI